MSVKPNNTTAYGHPTHAAFNEQLEARSQPANDTLTSPWIAPDKHPAMRREFADSGDPLVKAQRLAQEKTEAERRREQGGDADGSGGKGVGHTRQRGSHMVQSDSARPALKPAHHMRSSVDSQSFNQRWMIEKRDAALAAADLKASQPQQHNHAHGHNQGKSHGPSM